MSKHYDENKCVASLARNHKVNVTYDMGFKVLEIPKDNTIGIHSWGMIDFLTNYCGYRARYKVTSGTKVTIAKAKRHKKQNKQQYGEED